MSQIASIQPGQTTPNGALPYPFHVDLATGDVQQQSFWKGAIARIVGFQQSADDQSVDLWFEDFVKDPSQAEGMLVVGVSNTGDMAQWGGPITSVTVREFATVIA